MATTKEKVQMVVDVTISYNSKKGRVAALATARDELFCDVVGAAVGGVAYEAKSGRVRLLKPESTKGNK